MHSLSTWHAALLAYLRCTAECFTWYVGMGFHQTGQGNCGMHARPIYRLSAGGARTDVQT